MHSRQQIREAFVNALSGITGTTVYNGRVFPTYDAALPAIIVFSREEAIEIESNSGRLIGQQNRLLVVSVQGYIKSEETLDNDLDQMSVDIETAVFDDATLQNLVRCLDLESIEIDVSSEGENQIGVITNNFSCRYLTEDGKPEVILI